MSENPEEQQSTGVLGRIGSWLSPWRGKGPTSPTENASPTSSQTFKSEGQEESEECVRPRARAQQWEEKEQSSNPSPLSVSRDIFPSEEGDATQSARRDGSVVCSTETAGGGAKKEEFVECRKKSGGQGKEREESSNGASASGNPEKNASRLTHLSSSSEQGVVWDTDRAHTRPQARRQAQTQTGSKKLHVYLEETSVIHCNQDTRTGQDIVRTSVTKKNLKVLPKAKSSPGFDLSALSAENKTTNVRPESFYSALSGVSLKSRTEPEPEEQTEADSMGRKNASRRKVRKNSQGDGGNTPQDKTPPAAQAAPEGIPPSDNSVTSPQGKSPKTHMGESPVNSSSSSSKHNPPSQASPEGAESTSCPGTNKQLDNFQDSNSVNAASVVDGGADMEDDGSLYKVERKTETPESKRRSIKVSRSEVKLFSKNVPLNPKQSPAGDTQDFKLKDNKDEEQEKPKREIDSRVHGLKKIDEEPKPAAGRIADRINLFERSGAAGVNNLTFQTPRSADVSPVRKATDRLKESFVLSDQRSRSAERYGTARSGSASPAREKPMTIKERMKNFTEASKTEHKPALCQKPAMTGMSKKSTSSVAGAASKSPEPDNLGKLDTKEQIQTKAKSEITLKPDGQDTTIVEGKISISKDTGDTAELTNSISPQAKGPNRTGARSKRRKSREPTSPISPNSENKPDGSKPELTDIKQQVDNTDAAPASKELSLPSDKALGNTSDKQSLSDSKQKASKKEFEVLDKEKKQPAFKKESTDTAVKRQEEMPELSVSKDEPDTAACSGGTKMPIDKESVILPQKEEKAGGHSLLVTQRREKDSKDSTETSTPSPAVEKTPLMESPVESPKLDKELSDSKSKGKVINEKDAEQTPQPKNKDAELIKQAESKDVEKLEKVESKKTNQAEKKNKDKPQQLLRSDINTTKAKVSDSRRGISETEGSAARGDESKNAERKDEKQSVEVVSKPETNHPEPASQSEKTGVISDPTAQKHVTQTKTTRPEKAAVSETNKAGSVTKSENGPSKGEKATKEPASQSSEKSGVTSDHSAQKHVRQTKTTRPEKAAVCETNEAGSVTKGEKATKEPASQSSEKSGVTSDLSAQKHVRQTKATCPEKAAVSETNKAGSVTKSENGPSKGEKATKEPACQSSEKSGVTSDHSVQKHVRQTKTTRPEKAAVCETNETTKGEKATNMPSELQTKSAKSPGTKPEPAVIAAEPQTHSVSVEKTDNSADDSCGHGANDARFSSSKSITKATTAAEKVSAVGTPALITAQAGNMSEKELSVKESTPISVSKSASSKGLEQDDGEKTVKSLPSEVKVSGDVMTQAQQCEESLQKTTESISELKHTAQSPSDSAASSSTVNVVRKTAEKTLPTPSSELSPVANGDVSLQLCTVKKELVNNKLSQTQKAPTSSKATKPIPDSTQRSSMKKLHLPRGLSKDDLASGQDAPSSWLDVDFPKQRLKVQAAKLTYSGSESNLLDASDELDDDDFIEKIKKLCAPFQLPPRKHNTLRQPQPPFAMPAIKEDRFEKTFDPDEFKFGLRKKKFNVDTTPSLLANLQSKETRSNLKPARASLADRSMLLSSLDTHFRLRDKSPGPNEEDDKEEKDDQFRVKSRLEGSCVLSSLTSSIFRGKRNGIQPEGEGSSSGEVSSDESPQLSPPPPSPTATAPPGLSNREEAQAGEAVVSDSGPPLPSFNDIKLPDYLEKYLPREPVQSMQGQEQAQTEVIGNMTTPASGGEADLTVRPLPAVLPDAVPPCFPALTHPTFPELQQPVAQPQGILSNRIRTPKGFHKRPGKMVLFEKAQFSGQAHEVYRDVADATALQLSPLISVKIVRGCWVLYEKPGFQGRCIALEEGGMELTNVWAEPGPETEPQKLPPMLIGSIRLAVGDYSLPHIDLFTEPEGHGRVTPYHDDTIETGSFGIPLNTASIRVHSGVWLVFSDPGFQGMIAVLETGEYPVPETWGFPSPFVGSLRPLKMGGFKVENPNEVKAVVYEEPGFKGSSLEIDSEVFSFCESEGDIATAGANFDATKLKSVGSLKIIGGLWVGYSEPGFEGQQHILEEGEYLDCSDWGGPEQLLSLRPILGDFMSPHLKMFSDINFGEVGVNIDLTVPVISIEDTGYGAKTQSIDVISGVWVVFEEPGFCGECYILEKGLYGSPEDWGALQPRVVSAMPVVLDDFENAAKFKVQLFSDPGFQGSVLPLEDSVASLQDGVSVASCKVLAGNWLAFEGEDFSGRMYVLEVGNYPDLRAMGYVNASSSIRSLQTVGFEFSLPSITLFERSGLRGKRVVLTDGSVNLQLAGGCSRVQSVSVDGGMWVLYEGINYRGAQILLKPGQVPDWRKFSSWQKIGSLRPLVQKRVHFRLRNRESRLMMSVTGDLDDVKLMRIQETEETDGFEQIWFYQSGHLHCKLLEECCLSPSGSVTMAGSRVGLCPELDNQLHLWSITPEGVICYSPTSDLVLDVKGGVHYDKNQVILKTHDPNRLQQQWDVEII